MMESTRYAAAVLACGSPFYVLASLAVFAKMNSCKQKLTQSCATGSRKAILNFAMKAAQHVPKKQSEEFPLQLYVIKPRNLHCA
ncbi:hypothetical protein L596_002662 [Steinernema carpocapsae]|uniref:Uncharacterized protein n=1 Tax=Steinernema carpocapsae TaxID=34508 RepID=A0A4V6I7R1_STECR|nr:hypothetical protein L596_002662 [Steinernema carpocapsae]